MTRYLLVAALLLTACDDGTAPAPRRDAGPGGGGSDAGMDAGVVSDGGDAGEPSDDAGEPGDDAGPGSDDGGEPVDGGDFDAGPDPADGGDFDAGPPTDAGELPDASVSDPCSTIPPGTTCTPGGCGAAERCLDNGCGEMRCFPAGHPCGSPADCAAGSACTGGVCVGPSGAGSCNDSRDCPLGFSCDGGSCADRRIACSLDVICPHGFYCEQSLATSSPYCFRAHDPCVADTGCPLGAMCRDVAGDGDSVCHIATGPGCRTNADCTMGVCGSDPVMFEASCQAFGPCASAADCNSGFTCSDVWGDGRTECIPPGACTTRTDCAAGEVCGVPYMGAATACIDRPL